MLAAAGDQGTRGGAPAGRDVGVQLHVVVDPRAADAALDGVDMPRQKRRVELVGQQLPVRASCTAGCTGCFTRALPGAARLMIIRRQHVVRLPPPLLPPPSRQEGHDHLASRSLALAVPRRPL
jgi:hypothetical protein